MTARLSATIRLKDQEPITLSDTFSGPRYTGQMGASALFNPLASIVNILVRNSMAPVRIESVDCDVQIEPGRKVAAIESVRLLSDTVEPGQELKGFVTIKPHKGERETIEISLPIPSGFPGGLLRGDVLRRVQQRPAVGPQRSGPARTARPGGHPPHAEGPDRPEADGGLPARPRSGPGHLDPGAAAAEPARERPLGLRLEARGPRCSRSARTWCGSAPTSWVVEGSQTLRFTVVKDAGLSLSLYR